MISHRMARRLHWLLLWPAICLLSATAVGLDVERRISRSRVADEERIQLIVELLERSINSPHIINFRRLAEVIEGQSAIQLRECLAGLLPPRRGSDWQIVRLKPLKPEKTETGYVVDVKVACETGFAGICEVGQWV